MEALVPLLFLFAGIAVLYFGAEALVLGASRLAFNLGVPPLVIGLTVVAFSTSMPEAVAAFMAQLKGGKGDIALGNIIGSNIANIGLVLGVSGLILPLQLSKVIKVRETPVMLLVSLGTLYFFKDGVIGKGTATLFLVVLLAYVVFQIVTARNGEAETIEELHLEKQDAKGIFVDLAYVLGGVIGLVIGGWLLVDGAVDLARIAGISERVIGLTMIAVGTSLPELTTSLVAAARKQSDISIGNILGSNVFNLLFVPGSVSLVYPIQFSQQFFAFDYPAMLGISFLLWGVMWKQQKIGRLQSGLLFGAYILYIASLF